MLVTAKKVYTINWDGNAKDYIKFADEVVQKYCHHRLDSLDFGDATGAFIEAHEALMILENTDSSSAFMYNSSVCTVDEDWESFEYEGNLNTRTQLTEEELEG